MEWIRLQRLSALPFGVFILSGFAALSPCHAAPLNVDPPIGVVSTVEGAWFIHEPAGAGHPVSNMMLLASGAIIRAGDSVGTLKLVLFDGRQVALDARNPSEWPAQPFTLHEGLAARDRVKAAVVRIFAGNRARLIPTLARGGDTDSACDWLFISDARKGFAGLRGLPGPEAGGLTLTAKPVETRGIDEIKLGEPLTLEWRTEDPPRLGSGCYEITFPDDAPWNGRQAWVLFVPRKAVKQLERQWAEIEQYINALSEQDPDVRCGVRRAALLALYVAQPNEP